MTLPSYYGNINDDLLRLTPLSAKRILEVGCGEGAFAAAYKRRNPVAEYVAIEAHAESASVARDRVDRLICADFTALGEGELRDLGVFDVIVLGDVLEHLPDPWVALGRLKQLLAPEGYLCLSVPNVSYWATTANVMNGAWPAEDDGLFDRTHLRFFTLSSLNDILRQSGFNMEKARARQFPINDVGQRWIAVLANAAEAAGLNRDRFIDRAKTIQYVAVSRLDSAAPLHRLHVHMAGMAPELLEIRTHLPLGLMSSDPGVTLTYREKSADLPDVGLEAPKVAVLQRLIMRDQDHWRRYVDMAREKGWLLVYEIDDHPELIGQVNLAQGADFTAHIREAIARGCHAVQTSTPALADVLRSLNPEVEIFPNGVVELPPFVAKSGQRVFYGALNREGFSARVAASLEPAITAAPDLEFVVVHDRAFFDALPTARKTFKAALSYSDYLAEMGACDIVLSPLEGTPSERHKSDVKFLEAARSSAMMIASPCVYEETIVDGRTGMIARDLSAWSDQLLRAAQDPDLRQTLARNAWTYVRDGRMLAPQAIRRERWYRDLWARRRELDQALQARWAAADRTKVEPV